MEAESKTYTPSPSAKARNMLKAGMEPRQIAETLGIPVGTVNSIRRKMRAAGYKVKGIKRKALSKKQHEEIRRRRQAGQPIRDIARIMGISRSAAWRVVRNRSYDGLPEGQWVVNAEGAAIPTRETIAARAAELRRRIDDEHRRTARLVEKYIPGIRVIKGFYVFRERSERISLLPPLSTKAELG